MEVLNFVKEKKIVFAMMGLPARGKTYISNKIVCYLNWLGFNAKFFNIGKYRRETYGTKECTSDFFAPENESAVAARKECAIKALGDLVKYLKNGGDIAVYDGTNTTVERRKMVKEYLDKELGFHSLVWIESICNDDKIIENNIRATKLSSPDYQGVDPEIAIEDFKKRIEEYKKVYEEVSTEKDGDDVSFIKLCNVTKKIVINNITGYIEAKLVSFLMNLHIIPRLIYLVRHGQSIYNVENRVGGDSDLSERGYAYLPKLRDYFNEEKEQGIVSDKIMIFTSTLKRAILTAEAIDIGARVFSLKMLDELDAGICDGLVYDEIAEKHPEEWKARVSDKLKYRFPMGESYIDLINRVEPIIFAIERSKEHVIVVSHQAVLRCIYGYFTKKTVNQIPFIPIPLGTVIKLNPNAYDNNEERCNLEYDPKVRTFGDLS